ncbi:RNA polymerase subunit sigma-70 [Macrococcus lamae]|uniref:RNA polymerase subunit sigma-70 n=1 Tax=Macrococcus lamae TaxID=198484 RepID=A0A4R6BT94_9STAP|nr:RNA polymerase subunit sigma-70 [Macrococcus lamae]TDM07715.1 RNA polymerase subunit sigma-70 [Macrococcus lamae]
METVNLLNLLEKGIVKKGSHVINVPINRPNGQKYSGNTYMIPLEYLYYNDQNGRIGVALSEYESQNGKVTPGHNEEYNMIIQEMLCNDSNSKINKEMKILKQDILTKGQQEVGYVLNDGRVIDGNRRFTAKRLLQQDSEVTVDQYFEAVILDELSLENHQDHRLIKSLELQIQFGRVEKVDYDPVDRAIDAYKTIVKEKIMTVKDYATFANLKTNEVNKRILEAELILKFLKFSNAESDNYSLAKQFDLDGPMQDIIPQYKKIKGQENEELILNALFSKLIQLKMSREDFKGEFRQIVKEVIGSKKEEEFLEEMEEHTDIIQDKLSEKEVIKNKLELVNAFVEEEELADAINNIKKVSNVVVESVKNEKDFNKPVLLARKALNNLNSMDQSTINEISGKEGEEFYKILQEIITFIENINNKE